MTAVFGGTFPCDLVPSIDSNKLYFINADTSLTDGSHWMIGGRYYNRVFFGDPLGFSYTYYGSIITKYTYYGSIITKWLEKPGLAVLTLDRQIQSDTSELCGGFCLVILYLLSRNYGVHEIERMFSKDPRLNDKIVQIFCYRRLGVNLHKLIKVNETI